ncbi:restriction endonuclease [Gallibacterium trehalosifermentans]|uniref:Restriction endonuclease n=1 Tax=Gallibacterium trehalosifermentans TaxID=516935 RepID=A0ABV6H1Y5_9PAST
MKISALLDEKELLALQQQFYDYFTTGYEFEEFLKEYLIKIGLDEVQVTKKSRDGGIDLVAVRKGIGDFSEIDTAHYFIQAKRYSLKNKINVKMIRELKGTIPFGHKGIMISTSNFTEDAKKEAVNDQSKPVVIIDGSSLIQSCIDNGVGFVFRPIFSREQMDIFTHKKGVSNVKSNMGINEDYIEKVITSNDVRARIISMPSSIIRLLPESLKRISVLVNDKEYSLTIDKSRRYLGGVTEILRKYNLLSIDNIITPKNAKWHFNNENNSIKLIIEN